VIQGGAKKMKGGGDNLRKEGTTLASDNGRRRGENIILWRRHVIVYH